MANNDSAADGQRSSVEVMDTIPESRAASPTIPAPTLSPTRETSEGMGLPPDLRRPALSPTGRNFPEQSGERLPGRRRGHSTSETLQPVTSNASRARAGSTSSSRQVRFPGLERRVTGNPGMRKRTTTWNLNGPSALQRQGTMRRRGTLAPPAISTGFDMGEARSDAGFTLAGAGSPIDNIIANQPYVDPGYVELNPAYEAPANTRPVWGLAKPLPRVVRAGMIPTRTEILQQAPQQSEYERRAEEEFDLEAGRVESSLNPSKISDALRTAQQDREFRLLRRYTGQNVGGPDLGRRPSVASNVPRRSTDRYGKLDGQNSIAGSNTGNLGRLDSVQEQQTPDEAKHTNEDGWLADHAGADTPVHGGSEPEEWIEDPEELKPYDPELDEIHNLHTYWSVIRLKFREPLAELLAMTCQLTIGFAADLVVTTTGTSATTNANWAWGLASMIGIYIAGGISGAHLNPAVSIMLWIFRGFPLRKIPGYALAQLVGAFLAALIAFGLYRTSIIEYAGSADMATSGTYSAFVTHPQHSYIDASTAFFTEFVGTAILAVVVLALGDDSNAPPGAGMNAFIMGLVITVLLMAFGSNTGLALNPARDFGPRLALLALGYGKANTFPSAYWFWGAWCGPIAGALFGAFLYDAAIFVGGESPVNYPRKRIKRAIRKKKAKWGRRFKKVAGLSVSMPLRRPRYASDDWHFDVREDE